MTEQDIDQMEAGPALNRRVAEEVMGWELRGGYWMSPGATMGIEGWCEEDWNSSEPRGIKAAWEVMEKFKASGYLCSLDGNDGGWACWFTEDVDEDTVPTGGHGDGDTAQLAICRAALKAKLAAAA